MNLPYSEACERNKSPILEALKHVMPEQGIVLEIGSCSGQHAVFFAPQFPSIQWQPSDQVEYLKGLASRLRLEGSGNILPALELNVLGVWPEQEFDAVFSSNTAHIMGWDAVCAMFEGVGARLRQGGCFCLYGPFNQDGEFTSLSNAEFDHSLKIRDPQMGIRDVAELAALADCNHMTMERAFSLPANNQMLVFRKNDVRISGNSNLD